MTVINVDIENKLTKIDLVDEEVELNITSVNNGSLFVNILKTTKLVINSLIRHEVNILYWNDNANDIEISETNNIEENAILNLAYGQLEKGFVTYNSVNNLNGMYASINLKTATLSESNKKYYMDVINKASFTTANMENYCVCLKNSKYDLEAIGRIIKGAKGSKSFQSSRALTFDNPKLASIKPLLLIDENDVEASHATSVGQIDENQMYYLQSRGLTYAQATNLVTIGYLLPISEFLEDEDLKQILKEKIETKVNSLCSM